MRIRPTIPFFVIGALIAGVLIASIGLALREPGPFYRGKSMHHWFEMAVREGAHGPGTRAVYDLGPKAAPYLGVVVRGRNSKFHRFISSKLPSFAQRWLSKDPDPYRQMRAAQLLASLGPKAGPGVPGLIEALRDRDENVRVMALQALWQIGPSAKRAGPALLTVLNDPSWSVREQALHALADVQWDRDESLKAITKSLEDPKVPVRRAAARALVTIAQIPANAVPMLRALLREEDPLTKTAAAMALHCYDPSDPEPLEIVIASLTAKDHPLLRSITAHFAGQIGERAKPCVPVLRELCRDAELSVRLSATNALKRIAPETFLAGLQE